MAGMEIDFPEDFMGELLMTDTEELCCEMLSEAAPIYEKSMKNSMKKVITHEGDSEMIASVKSSKPKRTKTNAYIVNIGPSGSSKIKKYVRKDSTTKQAVRTEKVTNAVKAIWKEYGIPGRQAAQPFMTNAKNNAEQEVLNTMQTVYERKVGAE